MSGGGQSYHFPESFKLEKRIKDILEPYGTVDESFYFKPEQLLRIISHCDRKVEEGCGFKAQFHTEDEISGCITTRYGQRETDPVIKEGISIHPLNHKMEFQGFNSIQSDTAPCLTAHDGRGGEPCLWERTDKIIKLGNYTPKGTHAGTSVSPEGIAPTVMGQHGIVTGVVEPVMKQVGAIYGNNAQAGRIYDENGISPALKCYTGGNSEPKILTSVRTEKAKELRKKGIEVFANRQLIPREDGISNTITTVTKDNLLQEPAILQRPHGWNPGGLFQEVSPTITTSSWEANNLLKEPQICSDPRKEFGRIDFSEIFPTIVATDCKSPKIVREPIKLSFENLPDKTVLKDEDGKGYLWQDGGLWRVRKLTEKECFRLMDVSDDDIEKIQSYPFRTYAEREKAINEANARCDKKELNRIKRESISKSAQYSLAGNSIVTQVLFCIFENLFVPLQSRYSKSNRPILLSLF